MAVARRRSSRDDEPAEDRPTRRRGSRDDDSRGEDNKPLRGRGRSRDEDKDEPAEDEDRPRRGRRSREDDEPDEKPRRGRSKSREDDEEKDEPRRGRRGSRSGGSRGGRGTSGFGAYSSKKQSTGDFADEFKPGTDNPVIIKLLEEGPFDTYNQHWIDDLPRDVKRKSYICLDDDYFGDEDDRPECPLCEIGEGSRTFALFNVLDLSNPRKPQVKVWAAPASVTDKFERASNEKKTSPLNREDVYFEVELVSKGKKKEWSVTPVKGRDLEEDYEIEPLDQDEIDDFASDLHDDRKAVTKVDSFEELEELADALMD